MNNGNQRFPDTRMGVEQVLDDAFSRAKDYENALKAAATASTPAVKGKKTAAPAVDPYSTVRRDLELEALVKS